MPSQTFTSSGTWNAPANLSGAPQVQAWGPGGNGAAHGITAGGGGGGGEESAENTLGGVTPGSTTLTITITAGAATTVTGGSVTVTAHAGSTATSSTGAAGGTGSTNSTHFNGGAGANGSGSTGGGGGSSAGTAAAGNNGSGSAGGTAPAGGGNGGNGGVSATGSNGTAPGGGGGGGGSGSGGTGAGGQVVITWSVADTGTGGLAAAPPAMSGTGGEAPTGTGGLQAAAPAMHGSGAAIPPRLLISLASQSGTDDYGNTFPQGIYAAAGVIQGPEFLGTDFIINTSGTFYYSGVPASGNLILSITGAAGTDSFGNTYQAGFTAYNNANGTWAQLTNGAVNFAHGATISNALAGVLNILNSGNGIVVNANTGEIDLNATQVNANGNSVTGLFGYLDPSGWPLSPSATLGAVIATVNSIVDRLRSAGICQ